MNIHYLQHVPFEGPGSIESWAITHGHSLTCTRLYAGDPLPALSRFDMLIVLGGPMSVHDEFEHVWLKAEKWFIRQVIDAEKPVLGICLGAQLIAEVLGAEVYSANQKEIGWYPLTLDKTFAASALGENLPQNPEVFHWHGETFTLPDGAARIASTPLCESQGFIYDNNIIALQFHLEATYSGAESLIENSRHEMTGSGNIQTEEEILSDPLRFTRANRMMEIFLTNLENLSG
ncbi:MAG: type 1 glutamine amidotransferase [Pseudomonadota bacterium]